jgi:hypothetical protein
VILLDIYKTIMDGVERQICPADLEMLQTTRRQDHKRLLISECIIGEGDVSPDALEAQSRVPKTKGWRRLLAGWVGQNLLRMTSDAWWLWVPCRPCHRLRLFAGPVIRASPVSRAGADCERLSELDVAGLYASRVDQVDPTLSRCTERDHGAALAIRSELGHTLQ